MLSQNLLGGNSSINSLFEEFKLFIGKECFQETFHIFIKITNGFNKESQMETLCARLYSVSLWGTQTSRLKT